MRVTASKSFSVAVILLVASSLAANQAADKEKLKKATPQQPSVVQIPKQLVLDAQQQEAVAALNAEYLPKLEELKQQQGAVLTAEQKQTQANAKNSAGKDKAELAKRLRDAVQLSEAQIQQQADLKKRMIELNAEIRDRFVKLLTAEQREILAQAKSEAKQASGQPTGEKKPAGEKPSSKKPAAEKPVDKKSSAEKPTNKKSVSEKPAQKGAPDKKPAGKKSDAKKPDSQAPAKKVEKDGKGQPQKKPTDKK